MITIIYGHIRFKDSFMSCKGSEVFKGSTEKSQLGSMEGCLIIDKTKKVVSNQNGQDLETYSPWYIVHEKTHSDEIEPYYKNFK